MMEFKPTYNVAQRLAVIRALESMVKELQYNHDNACDVVAQMAKSKEDYSEDDWRKAETTRDIEFAKMLAVIEASRRVVSVIGDVC